MDKTNLLVISCLFISFITDPRFVSPMTISAYEVFLFFNVFYFNGIDLVQISNISKMNSTQVGLVINVLNGSISSQYHFVFDYMSSTVVSSTAVDPEV